ncbi:MAG TPA: excinuclease ABC subunit UvrA [Bacteroidia bacterium]|nr:excinuclease ABC subunit UvrA [Bacteroidia bacterium]HRU67002.1 excinuclease ABC subunit UvrA [Bacteroidia bacterium]
MHSHSPENCLSQKDFSLLSQKEFLIIKNARQNNLKNIDLAIPHGKIIVITGVSGSGKSSLAFETLYEEGRRRYVESLSAYARQFLGKMKKPLVDYIRGLPPAIAIEQRKSTNTSRSTVGTATEIHHYLKLLFARFGKIYSPFSGQEVHRHSIDEMTDYVLSHDDGVKVRILSAFTVQKDRNLQDELNLLLQKGFTRLYCSDEEREIEDILNETGTMGQKLEAEIFSQKVFVVIDRMIVRKNDNEFRTRVADSIQTATNEGNGRCWIQVNGDEIKMFSNLLELDGIRFDEPVPDLFSFNSPYGACPVCGGFGDILGIDENKVIPNKNLSIYDHAVSCWEGEKMGKWREDFVRKAPKYGFRIFEPYKNLTEEEKNLLWHGNGDVEGIMDFVSMLEGNAYKIHYRILISRLKGRTTCRACKGTRLRKEASYVKILGKSIGELLNQPVSSVLAFMREVEIAFEGNKAARRLLTEINTRLGMMEKVGLGYLTLNRSSRTLSGGENQRIQLIYALGSNLTGSLYILDEPSIGLHPKDTHQLIEILKELKRLGNTIIVVEHDEEIIRSADEIIDLGPGAGTNGGQLVFQGNVGKAANGFQGLTHAYLTGDMSVLIRKRRMDFDDFIEVREAVKHNLKSIDVSIPLHAMTVVTGVSGSGKTTLVSEVIYESLKPLADGLHPDFTGCTSISGSLNQIRHIEFVSQDSIDRSRRSNPATYLKVFDAIRELFASQNLARIKGFTPAHFSFNVEGGRCEECKGDGVINVEMQFLADMELICEECKGKRYKPDILEITYKEKNIDDVLNMTVAEASEFFSQHKNIVTGLEPLMMTGLDYLKLGQPTSSLSGGEAQRLKLAGFLSKAFRNVGHTLFIFDEPTTGLHWHDINKLMNAFEELLKNGHTLLIIEHQLDVIKNADYIIDLGPEGGEKGGYVVFQGKPEDILTVPNSHTARFLMNKLS